MASARKQYSIIALIVVVSLLSVLAVGGYYYYPKYKLKKALNQNIMAFGSDETAAVFIPTGSTAQTIADQLTEEGVINDKNAFLFVAGKMNYGGSKVLPGYYEVNGNMSVSELITNLRGGYGRKEVEFSTDAVFKLDQLCGEMTKNMELDSASLCTYLHSNEIKSKYGFNENTIISMFFANRYKANWAISADSLVGLMAHQFKVFWNAERKQKAADMGLSQSQVTTLASIVYAECGNVNASEWPIVAGLYFNRIKKNMKLQSDPTVKYALDDFEKKRIYYKDLDTEHPYNTYYIVGLPPGPIMTVKKEVVDAVLNYKKHNYIFMCAKPGGYTKGHNFAATDTEHSKNVRLYHNWANKNNIR